MKLAMRLFSVLMLTIMLLSTVCLAVSYNEITPTAVDTSGNDGANMAKKMRTVIGGIQIVGYTIAAGIIIYIGIKYIMATADEKANLKGSLYKYLIGALLLASATTIATWIFSAFV